MIKKGTPRRFVFVHATLRRGNIHFLVSKRKTTVFLNNLSGSLDFAFFCFVLSRLIRWISQLPPPLRWEKNYLFLRDIVRHLAVAFTTLLPPSSALIYNHLGKLKNYRENDKGRENPLRHTLENKSGARSLFFMNFLLPPSPSFFSVTGMCPVMLPNKKKAQWHYFPCVHIRIAQRNPKV